MTRQTRRTAVAGAVIAAIVCIVVGWFRHADHEPPTPRTAGGVAVRGAHAPIAVNAELASRRSLYGQRNVAARRIAGRVTENGQPFPGARVSLRWAGMEAGTPPPAPVTTDADGRFDLGAWFAERFTVTAAADGKTAAVVETDLRDPTTAPAPDQLELVLTRCLHTLVGTVTDGSGGVITGASVARLRSPGVATAADGSYALCLAAGRQTIAVTADGYGGVVLAVEIRGQVRRDVALVPGGAIHGSITEKRTGRPVADALVSAWPVAPGPDHAAEVLGHSDADGRFQLAGLSPGRFTVWASTGQLLGSAEVAVIPTRSAEVAIALSDTARVAGRIVANGAPVAGARVVARAIGRAVGSRPAISQRDGGFVLDEVPLGPVAFSAPPYEVISPARLTVDRPDLTGVVIEAVPMASISGRVTLDGQPVDGATVMITPDVLRVTADAQGQYRLAGLKPGTYLVRAETDRGASLPQTIAVKAGEQRTNVELELTNRSSIAGAVVDQDGRPVPGAIVTWADDATGDAARATSNVTGEFVVDRLRGGSYRASVRADERDTLLRFVGEPPMVTLDAQQPRAEGVQLVVRIDRGAISGRVVDAAGEAVADARIDVIAAPRDGAAVFHSWLRLPSAVSAVDGAFSIAGLAEGSYAVRARAPDDREAIAAPVAAGAHDVILQLSPASVIEVTLVGFASTPTVDAQHARGDLHKYQASVDGDHASFTGLPPGRYIVAAHNAQELDAAAVAIDGGVARITLTSHGSGQLTGTVRSFVTGAPVADMKCLMFPTADGMLGPEPAWDLSAAPASDAQGQFVIDPAPAGASAVYCYNPAARMSSARAFVTIATGGRATAQLLTVHAEPPALGDIGVDLDQGFPIVITSVRDDGPAAVAGIHAHDALVALDGHAIDQLSKGGVVYWLQSQRIGARITITVRRGADTLTLPVVVGRTLEPPLL
jgi:protocatechuate 3,4-dioxygenase beta subunit